MLKYMYEVAISMSSFKIYRFCHNQLKISFLLTNIHFLIKFLHHCFLKGQTSSFRLDDQWPDHILNDFICDLLKKYIGVVQL